MTNPNIPTSDEVRHEAGVDFIIAEDWDTRFTANAADMRALRSELDEVTDPEEVIRVTEMRGEALVRTLGSGALSLFKRDVIADRAEFEAEFGEGQ
jgi:hypothetical protein